MVNLDWKIFMASLEKKKFMYTRVIKREDMGKRICQRIYWDRRNSLAPTGWVYSSYACAEVPYDYDVEPSVSVNSDYIDAENVTKIEGINAGLNNKGTLKDSKFFVCTCSFCCKRG